MQPTLKTDFPSAAVPPQTRRLLPTSPERLRQSLAPLAIFVVLLAVVAVLQPGFFGGGGPTIIAIQATPILLVALGVTVVLLVGSIDLSIAAMALVSAIITAKALGGLGPVAPLLCLAVLVLIGSANGLILAYTQVPSFALTLGTLGVLQATALLLTNATTVYVTANQDVISWLFDDLVVGLPSGFWLAVVLAVVLWGFLRFTALGQELTALGYNEKGAIFSGLATRRLKVIAFGLSGAFAALAGVTVTAQAGSASSFGLGSDLLLPGIAAAVVGGTAITGAIANPINVIFGALFVALIPIGTAAVGVPAQAQNIVYGLVLIVAVAATITRTRSGIVK